jgi:hypothetical protein
MCGKHHRRVREELDAWRMARGLMHDGCTGIWLQGPRYGPRGGGDTTPQPRFLALVRDVRGGAGIAHWRGGLELLHTVGLRLRSRRGIADHWQRDACILDVSTSNSSVETKVAVALLRLGQPAAWPSALVWFCFSRLARHLIADRAARTSSSRRSEGRAHRPSAATPRAHHSTWPFRCHAVKP